MKRYRLICVSFDGDYVTERRDLESVAAAWDRSNDMGSRWYFYPFHFVTSESGKTITDAPEQLAHFIGMRVKTVATRFAEVSKRPDMQTADIDTFAGAL